MTSGRSVTRLDLWLAAAVALLAGLTFVPALSAGFVEWDDPLSIYSNPHIQHLDWASLRWMFTDVRYNPRYMPLTWLDWAITYQLVGLRPFAYHLGSLLLHAANALLLFGLIRRFQCLDSAEAPESARASLAAALGTLLWAIHPLRAEPVGWATDRSYPQSFFFLLIALHLYLSAVVPTPGAARPRLAYWGAVAAFACAVLSYPIVLGGAAVLLVLDVYPLRRFTDGYASATARKIYLEKLPFVLLAAGALVMTLWARVAVEHIWPAPAGLQQFTAGARVMQAFYIYAYYLWRPLVPVGLSPVYTALISFRPSDAPFVASLLLVVAVSALVVALRRRCPLLLVAWVCHLLLLAASLGLTEHPYSTGDRYAYVQGTLWAVLLAAGLQALWSAPVRRAIALWAYAAAGIYAAVLGLLAFRQVAIWHDSVRLYTHMIDTLGDDTYREVIHMRLGDLFMRRGEWERARRSLDVVLELAPGDPEGRFQRGMAEINLGRFDEARVDLEVVLRKRLDARAHNLLGVALRELGRDDEAAAHFSEALREKPDFIDARENLARLRRSPTH
jgi:tetratricopeptide (TPR) repeat protein